VNDTVDHGGEHSSFGPSRWDRMVRCPGSIQAERGIDDPGNHFAAEGTLFHWVMSECLENDFEPEDYLGTEDTIDGFDVEVDEEMVRIAADCIELLSSHRNDPNWNLMYEKRVDISDVVGNEQFGTADVIGWNSAEKRVLVLDWKYGMGVPVHAESSYQLIGYAYGAMKLLFHPDTWNDWKITLRIEQPRIPYAGGAINVTAAQLLDKAEEVNLAVKAGNGVDPERIAGDVQCEFCRAQEKCGVRASWFLTEFGIDPETMEAGDPDDLSLERRSRILKSRTKFVKWIDRLHAEAYEDALAGRPVPGMKLVHGRRPPRKYHKPQVAAAERVLVSLLGREGAYGKPKLITPTQAEKALGRDVYGESLAPLVNEGEPKPMLVDEEDKREAISSTMDMLDDID